MDEFIEVAAELLAVAVYAVGAVLAAAVGFLAEYTGYQQFSAGAGVSHAVWFGVVGAIALYIAVNLLGEFRAKLA